MKETTLKEWITENIFLKYDRNNAQRYKVRFYLNDGNFMKH